MFDGVRSGEYSRLRAFRMLRVHGHAATGGMHAVDDGGDDIGRDRRAIAPGRALAARPIHDELAPAAGMRQFLLGGTG